MPEQYFAQSNPEKAPMNGGKRVSLIQALSLALISSLTTLGVAWIGAQKAAHDTAEVVARTEAISTVEKSKPQLQKLAEDSAKSVILTIVDKLKIASAGKISKSGAVEFWKGIPFSVTPISEGRFRINFNVPFDPRAPIVLATPIDSATFVNVLDVDTTGFSIQGIALEGRRKTNVAFSFIAVEPEQENKQ